MGTCDVVRLYLVFFDSAVLIKIVSLFPDYAVSVVAEIVKLLSDYPEVLIFISGESIMSHVYALIRSRSSKDIR